MKTHVEKFNDWYEAEKKNGLVYIKFFGAITDENATLESFSEEALAFLTSPISSEMPEGF